MKKKKKKELVMDREAWPIVWCLQGYKQLDMTERLN